MSEGIKVKVRECECPGKPHNGEGDWVLLAPTLSLEGGLAAERDLREAAKEVPVPEGVSAEEVVEASQERWEAIQRRWLITFVKHGARGWNFRDEEGDRPFDLQAILDDFGIAQPVADKAADLYSDVVLRPFVKRLAARSPTGQTSDTTSPRRRRTPKPSASSSPDTSAASAP